MGFNQLPVTVGDLSPETKVIACDVFIAGSGPIGATFARKILDATEELNTTVYMADMGAQDSPIVGSHHKNSVKYQEDLDAFVHVIRGQKPEENLMSYVTRAVGGMATHWTCACPHPNEEESVNKPVDALEFETLLTQARELLNVTTTAYDHSIRHNIVKKALEDAHLKVENLPLAVERLNEDYVRWSGVDTVLGPKWSASQPEGSRFTLSPETLTVRLLPEDPLSGKIGGVLLRDLKSGIKSSCYVVKAKYYVLACGAIGTPQVMANSYIRNPPSLGKHLTEQSIAFCQIALKRSIVEGGKSAFPVLYETRKPNVAATDPLEMNIPWGDPEPQLTIPYSHEKPWHTQIHRDAFSYGEVGFKADPRVIVDLRWFGKQDIHIENHVSFPELPQLDTLGGSIVEPFVDAYGMPQATFHVKRSEADGLRDHDMMNDMCNVAHVLGPFLPGSDPQFMASHHEPGLALHITGTTRLGRIIEKPEDQKDDAEKAHDKKVRQETVADQYSMVHGYENLFVGGNGCIPDSTACNPTRTSVAYAIKAAGHLVELLHRYHTEAA
ncbi:GMC oxidoreductase [Ceratobasidium sp. AG-Ba]|nr:GMC oxidoreductase [Ceratobasidium sp. AG-Ba]